MKLLWISLALFIGISSATLNRKPECKNYPTTKGCPKIYRPVCGTDFRTYSNECLFCQYIHETKKFDLNVLHDGACSDTENQQADDPQMQEYIMKRERLQHP